MKRILLVITVITAIPVSLQLFAQSVSITPGKATIENRFVSIVFDLNNGKFQGIDKISKTMIFKDAWFRLDPGKNAWKTPPHSYKAENMGEVKNVIGEGNRIRVWYLPELGYDPQRFLDLTLYKNKKFIVLNWGVKNNFGYTVRVQRAEILHQGVLFNGDTPINPKVLRSGAGATANFVENTWIIDALNGAMLTYIDRQNRRRTIVGGGLNYNEFAKSFETHKGKKRILSNGNVKYSGETPYLTLSIWDPQGKRIAPGETWISKDSYYLDFVTQNPFESLEQYGHFLAVANNANPNPYNFPTLCGWMVSTIGEGKPINNSPGLVEQMELAKEKGLNKYTSLAVRLEPDYYCYSNQGNTQQGWWDDEHWAKYGSLKAPYETFAKFSAAVEQKGGQVFTYIQTSMPSNDFAVMHPDWMLNDDISLLHVDHPHHQPLIRYDYTNPDFQNYVLSMWSRLSKDGVKGIKFDYPETAWARDGGFDDQSYTTTSAYRKVFELCREGMGDKAFIHERALGESNTPILDCTAGVVDLQRVWGDASYFEPEMASRMGLRWYKQGIVFRYYPDGKSFYNNKGEALSAKDRRTFLTLVGLLSGRIELGTSIGSMTDEMFFDLTRLYPVLPNGKSFRPVDFLLDKKHPEIYVYDVNSKWKQVILINNDKEKKRVISAPLSGDQVTCGSIGFSPTARYVVFDFWNQKAVGVFSGKEKLTRELDEGEALVFSVKELDDYPQIIGTNRHVMCGMFEIKNEKWKEQTNILTFNASVIKTETMNIIIHLPEGKKMRVKKLSADYAKASYFVKDNYLTVSLLNKNKNIDTRVTVKF